MNQESKLTDTTYLHSLHQFYFPTYEVPVHCHSVVMNLLFCRVQRTYKIHAASGGHDHEVYDPNSSFGVESHLRHALFSILQHSALMLVCAPTFRL